MFKGGLFAALAACLFAVPSPAYAPVAKLPAAATTPYTVDGETIHRLVCRKPLAGSGHIGTGVRVSTTQVATAWHVVGGMPCTVDGIPAKLAYADPARDFAILEARPSGLRTNIDCTRPKNGAIYLAVGYAESSRALRIFPAVSNRDKPPEGLGQVFDGASIEGQSGGPVIDLLTGRPVGVIVMRLAMNAASPRWRMAATLFADTPLCQA